MVGLVAESLSTKKCVMKYCPRSRHCWEHGSTEMKRVCTFLQGVCICMVQCPRRQLSSSKRGLHPRTDHEDPEGEKKYSCTLSLTWRRWDCVVNATPRPLYPRERDPVPTVQRGWKGSRLVWTGAENLAPTGIRSQNRSSRGEFVRYPCSQSS